MEQERNAHLYAYALARSLELELLQALLANNYGKEHQGKVLKQSAKSSAAVFTNLQVEELVYCRPVQRVERVPLREYISEWLRVH